MWFVVLIGMLTSYLLGNLNGAVCMSALMHDDVRSHGSGNAGLTNFVRSYGAGRALYVILIDAGKATLACLVTSLLLRPFGYALEGAALGGLGVTLGHIFPALLGFKGGKGILSSLFVALAVDWRIGLVCIVIFAAAYCLTRYVSLGSVLAAAGFIISFVVFHWSNPIVMICGIIMGSLAIWMHRGNISRLIQGKERKTNLFRKGKHS